MCFFQVSEMVSMVSDPATRQGALPLIKPTPSIIQAAPTVYSAPPATGGYKRNDVRAQRQARMVFRFWLMAHKIMSALLKVLYSGNLLCARNSTTMWICCIVYFKMLRGKQWTVTLLCVGVWSVFCRYECKQLLYYKTVHSWTAVSNVDISGRIGSSGRRAAGSSEGSRPTRQEGKRR